ncbi:MAG: hypothetical protein PHP97_01955 [Candidatus Shapirobacteria bacterium]|nr:hypothetical protein [Candidatus Shapirobacteria bacterium]MDD3003122.1 hypothetical protein [Candidatus Shapirobacteria bacterium]MDD4383186.1 hypothetical protein [Candidatus Shapirobacteria bacterium]
MTQDVGYKITKQDIDSTIIYLKTQNKPNSREDAINYLQEKAAVAHVAAHKIVEDEQSGKIDLVKLKR